MSVELKATDFQNAKLACAIQKDLKTTFAMLPMDNVTAKTILEAKIATNVLQNITDSQLAKFVYAIKMEL